MPVDLHVQPVLDDVEAAAVDELAHRIEAADGVSPLNDDARLALRHARPDTVHVLARAGADLVGYAQLEHAGDQPSAVLGVDPARRRQGIGHALAAAVEQQTSRAAGFWAFRDLPAAHAFAESHHLEPVRRLLMMRADLGDDVPAANPLEGVAVRAFVPGQDEQAWLAVNASAFADHPEQGRMTLLDLQDRMAEDWFDPADFLLAVDTRNSTDTRDPVVGFHWTKRHSPTRGEVYVLGVDSAYGGRGLGTTLLLSGLAHLASIGVSEVILYVEAEHERAVRLYAGHGFDTVTRDVMYARPSERPVPPGASRRRADGDDRVRAAAHPGP